MKFLKKFNKNKEKIANNSKEAAKERLHLVLMQDRANVSADFLELMKQEIIEVIKKYIDVDEAAIDVRLTNQENEDGTNGAPALYANIPIKNMKNEGKKGEVKEIATKKEDNKKDNKKENKEETTKTEPIKEEKEEKEEIKNEDKTEEVVQVALEEKEETKEAEEEQPKKKEELKPEN